MDGFEDAKQLGGSNAAVFDASQYAFFGNDAVEEVDLGGLGEDDLDTSMVSIKDEYQFDIVEGDCVRSSSDFKDLSNMFSKLNMVVSEPRIGGIFSDRSSESSVAAEWAHDTDYFNSYEPYAYHLEDPYSSPANIAEKPLHRTASYPDPQSQLVPQHHQNLPSEPIPVPKSSFSACASGGRAPHNLYLPSGSHMALHSQNSFPSPSPGLPNGPQPATNLFPGGLSADSCSTNQWLGRADLMNNILPHQLPHPNGMTPPQLAQQQPRLLHQNHPSYGHLTGVRSQRHSPHIFPAAPTLNQYDAMLGISDIRDQRAISLEKDRQNLRYPQQRFDVNNQKVDGVCPVFWSNFMTGLELENILRMQLAATQSNDPYVDDYYHQACLAKRTSGARLRHPFLPTQVRDLPPRARMIDEPRPFLQVEALGRFPFSSIRRPKPLLEVDSPSSTSRGNNEQKIIDKPLDQEPMLAARVTVEDCLCLLLNIDDIDRFLQFNHFPDGGTELRQRRQSQLEGLATSLQLVDPFGKGGQTPKDDIIFIRIISLPKGRKLIGKYLEVLSPGTELLRIVCMAIFRHSRFLFSVLPSDPAVTEVTAHLAKTVSSCVSLLDLNGLSACLAAVVCSSEPPPLWPIGNSAGDGASVVLKSVLDRAAGILGDPHAGGGYCTPTPAFWQASFDEFFTLLLKYCVKKYDTIMQASPNLAGVGSDLGRAIQREMPVDLLRASLPHTNDHQRKILMELAQRSVPVV